MTFINYCGHWHELDLDRMKMWNYRGGYCTINENDEEYFMAECRDFEDWHQIYVETGYMPWETERFIEDDIWIAPNGKYVVSGVVALQFFHAYPLGLRGTQINGNQFKVGGADALPIQAQSRHGGVVAALVDEPLGEHLQPIS